MSPPADCPPALLVGLWLLRHAAAEERSAALALAVVRVLKGV